ncbi:arsenate reductase (glutaredoxin) [Pokkaliibacter sp. CJK22405]|uniref:arsenate reductase (glutaredoxin) n=1 Tax=Pokkaliibacter sp. CJK22405 TaxID=3384615 RepID=UPI003984B014
MSRPVLLHNPRCSKSREALALLQEKGVEFEVREYLKDPLSRDELHQLAEKLGAPVKDWTRTNEDEYKQLNSGSTDDATLIAAMADTPKLMQRPILISGDRAAVGRPVEQILEILS